MVVLMQDLGRAISIVSISQLRYFSFQVSTVPARQFHTIEILLPSEMSRLLPSFNLTIEILLFSSFSMDAAETLRQFRTQKCSPCQQLLPRFNLTIEILLFSSPYLKTYPLSFNLTIEILLFSI